MSGTRQTIQYSLALEPVHQGETPVSGYQGAEPVVAKPAPERPALTEQVHVPDQADPSRTAGYVTRMPGGVGGVAPRGVPLSRSISSDPELGEIPHIRIPIKIGESVQVRTVAPKLGQQKCRDLPPSQADRCGDAPAAREGLAIIRCVLT